MEAQRKRKKKPGRTQATRRMKSVEPVQPESRRGAFLPTLEMITDNMSDLIRVTDLQGINLYASPSHERILGYKPEDRVGKSAFDILHPDDAGRIAGVFSEALIHKKPFKVEYRVRHAEGHYIWLETVGDLLRDDRGEALAVIMSSRDITDHKKMEKALRESEAKLKAIFDTVRTGILIIDQGTQIILEANQTAMEMIGLPKERIIGQLCHSFICPADVGKCPTEPPSASSRWVSGRVE